MSPDRKAATGSENDLGIKLFAILWFLGGIGPKLIAILWFLGCVWLMWAGGGVPG